MLSSYYNDHSYKSLLYRFKMTDLISDQILHVADIALRLLSSATSEASCERSIKKQRLIHNKRRLKSKKELLDVRMIHNSLT